MTSPMETSSEAAVEGVKAIGRGTLHLPLLHEVSASVCRAVEMVTSET